MEDRSNNFSVLRLLFASLVVVAHAPVLLDGNRSREILTVLFGPVTFGEVAVDGFFLISGYLITKSFASTRSIASFLVKRLFRIVPGYAASFAICVLVVAPWVGGTLSLSELADEAALMLYLACPAVPDAFKGLPYATLNGSMWTIAYEFRCYIATILLGMTGLYAGRSRFLLLALVMVLLVMNASGAVQDAHLTNEEIWGAPGKSVRLFAVYGVGSLFFVFRDRIQLTGRGATIAAAILIPALFSPTLSEAAIAICGGYLVFWIAFQVSPSWPSRFCDRTDLSYGLYLYAWPIQSLLIYWERELDPWILCAITLVLAGAAGSISWIVIERPALRLARTILATRSNALSSCSAPAAVS